MDNCARNNSIRLGHAIAKAHTDRNSRFYTVPALGPCQMITQYAALDYSIVDPITFPEQQLVETTIASDIPNGRWRASCIAPDNSLLCLEDRDRSSNSYRLVYWTPDTFTKHTGGLVWTSSLSRISVMRPSYDGQTIVLLKDDVNHMSDTLHICSFPWALPLPKLIMPAEMGTISVINSEGYVPADFACLPSGRHYAILRGFWLTVCTTSECIQRIDLEKNLRICYSLDITVDEVLGARIFCYYRDSAVIYNFDIASSQIIIDSLIEHSFGFYTHVVRLQSISDAFFVYRDMPSDSDKLLLYDNAFCAVQQIGTVPLPLHAYGGIAQHVTHDGRTLIVGTAQQIFYYRVKAKNSTNV
jgi:hypothetical protein